MSEPVWLPLDLVLAIHQEQLADFGGPAGIRDKGALESALGRPRNQWANEGKGLAELAAAYAFGIARNHPFLDGNKRAAFLSMIAFLGLNDVDFLADEAEATAIFLDLAAGNVSEEGLTRWIKDNWPAGI
jgi:death on curing protein